MKKKLHCTCLLLYATASTFANTGVERSEKAYMKAPLSIVATATQQNKQDIIRGTVRDQAGVTLIGVSVLVKGTKTGTQTDVNGLYTLNSNPGAILVFSYLGYLSQEVTVGDLKTVNVTLMGDTKQLNEVVVTALGIKRSEKSLTYSTQQVSGEELTRVKSDNLMNSLNGKIAGVTISPSASGVGGSAKVILRGNRSFSGNNQPLYVIDGVPISNSANKTEQPNSPFGGSTNVDGGDGISNLNPDDIESMSVLKGASASALYGSQAANGVILITTKRGKAGSMQMNFNSSFSTDQIVAKPEFQNDFGRTTASSTQSWGTKLTSGDSKDNMDLFFQTGNNWTNSLNLSGGTENAQTYFSYANTHAKGVQPGNNLDRNNFNLRETAKFLNNKLSVDASINYMSQEINNSPGLGYYFNPLTGLYLFPRGLDITPYKEQYELNEKTGYDRQNWINSLDIQQNPWWITNRNLNISNRNRVLANGSLKYELNKWLNIQARGTLDRISDSYEQDLYSGTQSTLSKANGQYILNNQTLEQNYGDVLVNFNTPLSTSFKIDGILGTSITDSKTVGANIGAGLGLSTPNLFIAQNTLTTGISNTSTLAARHSQLQSIFGNVNVAFNDWAFLTLTGRSDWSSNLAFTSTQSYFYPSVGLSFLLKQMIKLPDVISYAKIRGTYAQVGNTVPAYVTQPVNFLDPNNGSVLLTSVAPFPALKPEKTKTYEIGSDLRFFNSDLTFNFTYYKSNTVSQFIEIAPIPSSGYTKGYINGGEVENKGFEFMLGYNILKGSGFNWNSSINGSRNENKIIDVSSKNGLDRATLTASFNTNYESRLVNGGSYGDIYGNTTKKDDQGRILVNADGTPQINNDGFHYLGNPSPKFSLGWNNSFNYKKLNLSFLVDGKFGGQVLSATQAVLDEYGVSKASGDARNAGGVKINGVDDNGTALTSVDAKTWYTSIGGKGGVSEQYIYSATVVRLREASLGYSFPIKSNVVKTLRLALTGRNILYFYKKAPYDPEITMSTGNGLSGVDVFNQPATRNIGFSINLAL